MDDTANLGESIRAMLGKGEKAVYYMVTITNSGDDIYAYNAYLSFTMYDLDGFSYDSLVPISTQPDLGARGASGQDDQRLHSLRSICCQRTRLRDLPADITSETEAAWGTE